MKLRTIKQLQNLKGKRVLIRSDFNVDLDSRGRVLNDERIRRALPTYQYLLKKGAVVVAMTHLGRPNGVQKKFSVAPIAWDLSERLGVHALFVSDCVGAGVEKIINNAIPGTLIVLENTRFHKEDQKGDIGFAKKLARLGDIFVADAFGTAHRADASVAGVAKFLPTYAGLLMDEEITNIDSFIKKPKRPYVFVIGGAKLETKINLISELLDNADHILVGGALANTFLAVQGYGVGKSQVDKGCFDEVRDVFREVKSNVSIRHFAPTRHDKIILPVDFRVAKNKDAKTSQIVDFDKIPSNLAAFDVGPKTVKLFSQYIASAKTVVFNGAMGVFENPTFAKSTRELYTKVAKAKARTLAGGGETIVALDQWKLSKKINYISTGGGAMLTYIEGAKMPGIAVIPRTKK